MQELFIQNCLFFPQLLHKRKGIFVIRCIAHGLFFMWKINLNPAKAQCNHIPSQIRQTLRMLIRSDTGLDHIFHRWTIYVICEALLPTL